VSSGTDGSGCDGSNMGGLQGGNRPNAVTSPSAADFANRSTARAARTIMGRKFGTGVLLPVALWLYFLSSILTLGEHEKGLHNLPEGSVIRPRIETALSALEARFAGRLLPVGDAVVRRWGAISGAVKRATGQTPPVVDTMLAATALEHEIYLVTRNTRDVQHSGATVFNPWTDDPASCRLRKMRTGSVIRSRR